MTPITHSQKRCDICFEEIYSENEPELYTCPETGRGALKGKPHLTLGISCMTTLASTLQKEGKEIICPHPGCKTSIAHLLPQPPNRSIETIEDFFSNRLTTTISLTGSSVLGISYLIGNGTPTMQSIAVGVAGALELALFDPNKKSTTAAAAATLAASVGAAVGLTSSASLPILKFCASIGAVGFSIMAGSVAGTLKTVRQHPQPRDFLSTAIATAAVVGASTLVGGGGLFMAGILATVSGMCSRTVSALTQ